MRRICGWLFAVAVAGSALNGCKSGDSVKQHNDGSASTPSSPVPSSVPLDPATLGAVSGTIHFAGKAPEKVKIDMSMDPVCSMTGADNFAEQYAVKDGKLGNVYVYIKSGPPAAMLAGGPTPAPVVLDQVGCKYVPHVIAVVRGGSVEFRNSDSTMHNIHTMPTVVGSQPIDISQGPKGTPQVKQFNQPEVMIPVRCNNHPWMNAFINVSATPFFAVTHADGHFTMSGLPAGTYTLAAVHEKMGEQTMTLTVEPKGTAKADFSFSAK
ncbi:carboxypeptidase regulatory-like domain-containing protein [Tunturiibacter lichenicola]|uniref:carboxypeptidase regulatory-like domain-containing protein n=1 Tax=Tunturiibacter lichenicola TaxID=2051959 RepID=UPI0021B28B40|nr:carboxypeptidase regulatory-like domain-containing protein [Edaphobacter lichenicola]